jgi:hypothetical protein
LNGFFVGFERWSHADTSLNDAIAQEQTFYSKTSSDCPPSIKKGTEGASPCHSAKFKFALKANSIFLAFSFSTKFYYHLRPDPVFAPHFKKSSGNFQGQARLFLPRQK